MKLIELPHKVCGYTCMINGLEDLYERHTGVHPPDWLFLHLSGLLDFVYLKNGQAPAARMVFWGRQIARYQYETLAGIVGFQWQMTSNRTFPYTLRRLKACIDRGTPALLGPLDMYHLPYYERFYHTFHVPIHHVLMVGYDDEQEAVLVQDCDRAEVQPIPYADLEAAWNVHLPGMGHKNTFYTFTFNPQIADIATIAHQGLLRRATAMLAAPASMFGIRGMRKLAHELPHWGEVLSARQLDASLLHLVEYTGFPPVLPNRLTGQAAPDNHGAGREVFAGLLRRLAGEYGEPSWAEAAPCFERSAQLLGQMTGSVVDFILGEKTSLEAAATLLNDIAEVEEQGFRLIGGCPANCGMPAPTSSLNPSTRV